MLTESEVSEAVQAMLQVLKLSQSAAAIAHDQPFRLDLLQAVAQACRDRDSGLPDILKVGVPVGIRAPILPSGIWCSKDAQGDQESIPPELHEANWGSA